MNDIVLVFYTIVILFMIQIVGALNRIAKALEAERKNFK